MEKILKLMKRYEDITGVDIHIELYPDGSGALCDDFEDFDFKNVDDLKKMLNVNEFEFGDKVKLKNFDYLGVYLEQISEDYSYVIFNNSAFLMNNVKTEELTKIE